MLYYYISNFKFLLHANLCVHDTVGGLCCMFKCQISSVFLIIPTVYWFMCVWNWLKENLFQTVLLWPGCRPLYILPTMLSKWLHVTVPFHLFIIAFYLYCKFLLVPDISCQPPSCLITSMSPLKIIQCKTNLLNKDGSI